VADNRVFRCALVASVALHGVLFLPFAQRVDYSPSAKVTPPIVARLMEPALAAPLAKSSPALKPLPRAAAKPAPPPPAPEVPEAVSRDQYRIELMAAALRQARERHPPKGYPQLARDNQWEGDVQVGVVVSASGGATLTLKGGSGYEVLDEQALDLLRQALQVVAVPLTLRGRDFAIDVRATYRLAD
jgi:TonB family protein